MPTNVEIRRFLSKIPNISREIAADTDAFHEILAQEGAVWKRFPYLMTLALTSGLNKSPEFLWSNLLMRYFDVSRMVVCGPMFGYFPFKSIEGVVLKLMDDAFGSGSMFFRIRTERAEVVGDIINDGAGVVCEIGGAFRCGNLEMEWLSPRIVPIRVSPGLAIPKLSFEYLPVWLHSHRKPGKPKGSSQGRGRGQ